MGEPAAINSCGTFLVLRYLRIAMLFGVPSTLKMAATSSCLPATTA